MDIAMRRVERTDKRRFGENEPGDFFWDDVEGSGPFRTGKLYLFFPPPPGLRAKYVVLWAPCSTTGGRTADNRHWNGDLDRPTVAGSFDSGGFHGWIRDGIMTDDGRNAT